MTLSMYQASIPVFIHQLEAIANVLAIGEDHAAKEGIDPQALFDARLAPDMFPLPKQVQIMTDVAKGGAARLGGIDAPVFADDETDIGQLKARIARTVEFLKSVPADAIDGTEEKDIVLKIAGREMPFKGQNYLLGFVLPNIFFHATTTYALLRMHGVPIGKKDFLGG